jgi:CheY-like chemotaxis protein
MNVLVVDDEKDMVDALTVVIETMGHRVLYAMNGETALTLLRREKPDVVLLDLNLGPGIDGWEVARQKSIDRNVAHIPVVIISAVSVETTNARETPANPLSGAVLRMGKPFDNTVLERTLMFIERNYCTRSL